MNATNLKATTGNAWRAVTMTTFRTRVAVDGVPYTVTAWTTPNGKMHVKADTARETVFGLPGMTAHTINAWRRDILDIDPTNAGYSYVTDAEVIRAGFRAVCAALNIDHPWCAP